MKMTKAQARKRLTEAQNKINKVFLSNTGVDLSMPDLLAMRKMLIKAFNKLK